MESFIKERLIYSYCWTHLTGRCKDCTCCYTFKKCKDFVNSFWKIHRYRHYHKTKAKYPTSLLSSEKELIHYFVKNFRLMEVERYYYAVASYMSKDGKISVSSVTNSIRGEKKDIKFYPLMNIITDVEEKFKDDMVSGTVVIQSVIEISKQDYDAYNERIAKVKEKDGKVDKGNG